MKEIKCFYDRCGDRRIHHERPDTPRPHRTAKVPDDYVVHKPWYCSYECAILDGAYSVTKGWLLEHCKECDVYWKKDDGHVCNKETGL